MLRPLAARWLILSMTVVLVLPACGDSADDAATGTSGIAPTVTVLEALGAYGTVIDPAAMETARQIVERLGPEAGFGAVVLALDAGYGTDQLAEHATVLTEDGTIPGVAPSGPASGVFTGATALGEESAQAVRVVLRLDDEPTPADFLTILNAKADRGEILTGRPAALDMNERDTVEAFVGAILALVEVGYSFDQVVEGLYLGEQRHVTYDDEDFGEGMRCILLAESDGTVITPTGKPVPGHHAARWCNEHIGSESMEVLIDGELVAAVTTTMAEADSSAEAEAEGEETSDGIYVGTVSVAGEHSGNATVLDSRVTISIVDGIATVEIDMTTEIVWVRFEDDTEPCISTDHWVVSGSGSASSTLSVELSADAFELIAISGCERDEEDEDDGLDTVPLTATVADGFVNGSFFDGLFLFAAERN